MVTSVLDPIWQRARASARRLLLPIAALAGLVALSGCYYGPYYPYGYYGYPGYAYVGPPVVGGVFIRGHWR